MLRQRTVGHLLGEMGKLMEAGEPRFPHLSRLMTTLLVVPAGNASSERVFSQVRKIATNFRSELCALFNVKWNTRQQLHVLGKVNSVCEVGNLSL